MKKCLAFLILIVGFVVYADLWAGPVAPIEIEASQPDGTSFTIIPRGDEFANWTETSEGHSIVLDNGTWFYAERDRAGKLKATDIRVGSLSRLELQSMPLHIAPAPGPEAFVPRTVRKIPRSTTAIQSKSGTSRVQALPPSTPVTQYILTVLVDYSDISFTYSDSSFQSLVYGAGNSIKDYFLENSYGRFTIVAASESYGTSNDGIIHVERTTTHPNQGNDNEVSDLEAGEIIKLTESFIDYAQFDTNADGLVSSDELSVMIILAGYDTSYGGAETAQTPNVWPHMSYYDHVTEDGVTLRNHVMVGEAHASSPQNKHQSTIGAMCHELAHLMLELPDLYDTDSSEDPDGASAGIGDWGLMGSGSWNRSGTWQGDSPAHMSAWSKIATNITTPTDIVTNQSAVSVNKADSNEDAKRIWIDKYKLREYFLVENRQRSGYDAGLPGNGLLIWHIDDGQTSNSDENHKWVDLEAADGQLHMDNGTNQGDWGDPFPGSTNNRTFNDTSTPNSRAYSGSATQIGVTGISSSSPTMTVNLAVASMDGGDNLSYYESGFKRGLGYSDSSTVWVGLRALNDTEHTTFNGVDVYVNDETGATIEIRFYSGMDGGTPSGLIHSQAGFAANPGWNRLILTTPQSFPIGAERGVVLKIVNNSGTHPASYVPFAGGSGRSYIDSNGTGTFYSLCPTYCGDLNLAVLLSSDAVNPLDLAITIFDVQDGTYSNGDELNFDVRIENLGGTASEAFRLNVYASADTTISAADINIGYVDFDALGAGDSHYFNITGSPPFDSMPNGNYYIGGILDIDDANNSNNSKYDETPITVENLLEPADLALTILDAANGSYGAGDTLRVDNKIENIGGASSNSYRLTFYASSDTNISSSDYSLGYTDRSSLAAGQNHYYFNEMTIPASLPHGQYYIGGILTVDDADSSNNSKYDASPITVTAPVSETVPDAPTLNSVDAGDGEAVIRFTASGDGGSPITGYTAACDSFTQPGSASPITVSGLSNGTTYSCSVIATNAIGDSAPSAAMSVTPVAGCTEMTPFYVALPRCRDDFEPAYSYSPTRGNLLVATGGSACLDRIILNPVVDNRWQQMAIYPDGTYEGEFEIDNFFMDEQGRASFDACIDESSPAIFTFGIYGNVTGIRMALGVREQCGEEVCIDITGRKQYTEAWENWGAKGVESGSQYTRVYIEDKLKEKIAQGNYFHEDGTPVSPDEVTVTNGDVGVLLGISGVTFAEPMNTGHLAGQDTQNVKIVEGTIYDYSRAGEEAISCFPSSSELKADGINILDNPDHCAYNLQNYPDKQVFEQMRYGHLSLGVLKKVGFTPYTSVQTSADGSVCTFSVTHDSDHGDTYTEFWQNEELQLKTEGSTADFMGDCTDVEAVAYVLDHKGKPVKRYKQTIPFSSS